MKPCNSRVKSRQHVSAPLRFDPSANWTQKKMNDSNNTLLDSNAALSPRFETAGPLLIAGLREPLDEHAAQKIPHLWQRLVACWDQIPQRVGITDYGLCIHLQGHEYYYMAGCAVWDFTGLPETFSPFIIPSQTYAVFTHDGHINH